MKSTKKPNSRNFKFYFLLSLIILLPLFNILYVKYSENKPLETLASTKKVEEDFSSYSYIRSVDTQVVSKHWEISDRKQVREQVKEIRDLGANYLAISTPYDYPDKIKLWADEAHAAGLNVWFRSHWLNWEGDKNHPADMKIEEYLLKTSQFIRSNPALFKEGDAFTAAVEPEQVFVARNILVDDWYLYNKFISDQLDMTESAFAEIDMLGKVHTNWISMNGWVVENGLDKSTVEKLGLITVDHYLTDVNLDPVQYAKTFRADLDRFYNKWHKPIILGEWGYNIEKEVSDDEQNQYVKSVLAEINDLPYLIGLNYWSHMGNTSRLINDINGKELSYRQSAYTLKNFFDLKATKK